MTAQFSTMREYALHKTGELLAQAASGIQDAADDPHEKAVHKMRVSIRRFQQAIRLFAQYLDEDGAKRVKSEMRSVMQAAGELRNRDIALALVSELNGATDKLQRERLECQEELQNTLKHIADAELKSRWQKKLGLDEDA